MKHPPVRFRYSAAQSHGRGRHTPPGAPRAPLSVPARRRPGHAWAPPEPGLRARPAPALPGQGESHLFGGGWGGVGVLDTQPCQVVPLPPPPPWHSATPSRQRAAFMGSTATPLAAAAEGKRRRGQSDGSSGRAAPITEPRWGPLGTGVGGNPWLQRPAWPPSGSLWESVLGLLGARSPLLYPYAHLLFVG